MSAHEAAAQQAEAQEAAVPLLLADEDDAPSSVPSRASGDAGACQLALVECADLCHEQACRKLGCLCGAPWHGQVCKTPLCMNTSKFRCEACNAAQATCSDITCARIVAA